LLMHSEGFFVKFKAVMFYICVKVAQK